MARSSVPLSTMKEKHKDDSHEWLAMSTASGDFGDYEWCNDCKQFHSENASWTKCRQDN